MNKFGKTFDAMGFKPGDTIVCTEAHSHMGTAGYNGGQPFTLGADENGRACWQSSYGTRGLFAAVEIERHATPLEDLGLAPDPTPNTSHGDKGLWAFTPGDTVRCVHCDDKHLFAMYGGSHPVTLVGNAVGDPRIQTCYVRDDVTTGILYEGSSGVFELVSAATEPATPTEVTENTETPVIVKDVMEALRAGRVKRWHMHPDMSDCGENDAEHQWSTVAILLWLDPDTTRDELLQAIFHDVGELHAGDQSFPFKRGNPVQAKVMSDFEDECRMKIVNIKPGKSTMLEFADRLSGWDKVCQHNPGLRHTDEWVTAMSKLEREAFALSDKIGWKVREFIATRNRELTERRQ
jgi:5'-deoxynucleotidase YfbR-like HD superfamily hydrolase